MKMYIYTIAFDLKTTTNFVDKEEITQTLIVCYSSEWWTAKYICAFVHFLINPFFKA